MEILIAVAAVSGGIGFGLGYLFRGARFWRRMKPQEDRSVGVARYQAFKDGNDGG